MIADTQVLLANGYYKPISEIQVNDIVLNEKLLPVQVLNVIKTPAQECLEIRHHNWYLPTYISKSMKLMELQFTDNFSELKWTSALDLKPGSLLSSEASIYTSILPSTFSVPTGKITLTPSFELGLIFGWYSGYGSILDNKVVFKFGENSALCDYVSDCFSRLFNIQPEICKNEYFYQCIIKEEYLVELFLNFKDKLHRQFPSEFICQNLDYINGIFEGLVDVDPENKIVRFIPLTKEMAELFLTVTSLLGYVFSNDTPGIEHQKGPRIYQLFVMGKQTDAYLSEVTSVTEIKTRHDMWNLSVDCPSNSFIANNIVVHAQSVPQLMAVEKDIQTFELKTIN